MNLKKVFKLLKLTLAWKDLTKEVYYRIMSYLQMKMKCKFRKKSKLTKILMLMEIIYFQSFKQLKN